MEIEGKVILDIPMVSGTSRTGNPWRKKEWVLETFGNFPRKVKFDTFGDRVDTVRFEVGKNYRVSVDAESREYNGRWYTDLRAYAAQEIGDNNYGSPAPAAYSAPAASPATASEPAAPVDPFASDGNDSDDLPF